MSALLVCQQCYSPSCICTEVVTRVEPSYMRVAALEAELAAARVSIYRYERDLAETERAHSKTMRLNVKYVEQRNALEVDLLEALLILRRFIEGAPLCGVIPATSNGAHWCYVHNFPVPCPVAEARELLERTAP